jgi:hypothetical protein
MQEWYFVSTYFKCILVIIPVQMGHDIRGTLENTGDSRRNLYAIFTATK